MMTSLCCFCIGLQKLESRDHKIKRKQVTVEFKPLSEDKPEPPQLKPDEDDGEEDGEEEEPTKIEVSNAPDVDIAVLKAFFEGPKSGGCEDAVAEIERISLGVFHVTFYDPKGIRYYLLLHNIIYESILS